MSIQNVLYVGVDRKGAEFIRNKLSFIHSQTYSTVYNKM